ncbi:MAG: glycoside hydrolase family 127 protein [Clostridia bacterium]|nr:glycoside hydrolase family 127 protein [Clostridia bacterium]
MTFYNQFTANYPRNNTDKFFDINREANFTGWLDRSLNLITDMQLRDAKMWRLFVEQFRGTPDDHDAGWRGEFWGKMMRGACFVYSYSKDKELYDVLKNTVNDLVESQDELGRISTYSVEKEYDGWDLWSRKYVLLGMQYFVEICDDQEFNAKVIDCMKKQVDYLMQRIGWQTEGKLLITRLTRHWRGLNSSSILEPIVRLYSLTEEKKYLDFAEYIVACGGMDVENVFELAYNNDLHPYQYPVTKAYEMTSCFVGLLEYYRITKNEKHLKAIINFANRVLEDDFTVIGSAGCTHELFDHSTVRQSNPDRGDPRAQETCVTVTLMQFFYQLNLITGDAKYMDAFERSLYNGYLGAVNTDGAIDTTAAKQYPELKMVPMPFDSYSPLTPGIRGNGTGGLKPFEDGRYYGCCICIGSAGIGVAMKTAVLTSGVGVVVNLYEKGAVNQPLANGNIVNLAFDTEYPVDNKVKITVDTDEKDDFEILLRNPYWSENTRCLVNGKEINVTKGYISIYRKWIKGDVIEIDFDMRAKAIFPIPYGSQILMNKVIWGANCMCPTFDREHPSTRNHIAIQYGPLMLAQENRLGYSVDDAVSVAVNEDGYVDIVIPENKTAPYACEIEAQIPTTDGGYFTVTDYASAGKLWTEESKMAVWFNTK